MMKQIFTILLLATAVFAQRELGVRPTETGGPLMFEQAVYDVQSYEVGIYVFPKTKSIAGVTTMVARTVIPTNVIVLDLDTPYEIESLLESDKAAKWERKGNKIWIWFPQTKQVGETIKTQINYKGTPKVAPRAPWIGGFMWEKTPSGADWISVALQNDGADLMFPCKDHPSDKPANVTMHLSVPDPLVATGPGLFFCVALEGARQPRTVQALSLHMAGTPDRRSRTCRPKGYGRNQRTLKAQDMRRVASHGRRARWASTARADAAGRDLHCGSALLRMRTLRVHGERCAQHDRKCSSSRVSGDYLKLEVVIQRQDDAAILGTLDARDAGEL